MKKHSKSSASLSISGRCCHHIKPTGPECVVVSQIVGVLVFLALDYMLLLKKNLKKELQKEKSGPSGPHHTSELDSVRQPDNCPSGLIPFLDFGPS
jgi:hypothetical protein